MAVTEAQQPEVNNEFPTPPEQVYRYMGHGLLDNTVVVHTDPDTDPIAHEVFAHPDSETQRIHSIDSCSHEDVPVGLIIVGPNSAGHPDVYKIARDSGAPVVVHPRDEGQSDDIHEQLGGIGYARLDTDGLFHPPEAPTTPWIFVPYNEQTPTGEDEL